MIIFIFNIIRYQDKFETVYIPKSKTFLYKSLNILIYVTRKQKINIYKIMIFIIITLYVILYIVLN